MVDSYKQILLEALMTKKAPLIRYNVLKNIIDDQVDQYVVDNNPFTMKDEDYLDLADKAYDGVDSSYMNLTDKQIEMYYYWFEHTPRQRIISYVKKVVKEYIVRCRLKPEMFKDVEEDERYY